MRRQTLPDGLVIGVVVGEVDQPDGMRRGRRTPSGRGLKSAFGIVAGLHKGFPAVGPGSALPGSVTPRLEQFSNLQGRTASRALPPLGPSSADLDFRRATYAKPIVVTIGNSGCGPISGFDCSRLAAGTLSPRSSVHLQVFILNMLVPNSLMTQPVKVRLVSGLWSAPCLRFHWGITVIYHVDIM